MAELQVPEVFAPLLKPARYKGAHGGRGSGKSHFFAGLCVARMATERNFRVVCVREVQNSIKDSVKQLIEDKIRDLGLEAFFTCTDQEIKGRNGSLAIFRGLQNHTAASIKSLEGFNVAWVEEAQTITQHSLDILTPTIRSPDSELWFSWNPVNEKDPVDALLRGAKPDNAIVVQANWSDNPFFPEALQEDLERDRAMNPDKFLHVWEGRYQSLSEARIFRNWRLGEMTPPERVVWHCGVDFGFAQDPTAALRCCLIGDRTLYIDHEAYEVGVPTDALPALIGKVPDVRKWVSTADSARPETIDYLRRNGLPKMRGAKKGKGSVEDGIMFLQGLEIVVHPRCVNLQRELGSYAYKIDKRTNDILPEPEDANNHLIDALRYACERLHRKGRLVPLSEIERAEKLAALPDYNRARDTGADNWKTA